MSFLEVATMLEEAFGHLGYYEFSCKLPNVDVLSSISTDNDVLIMCTNLDLCRLVYVYTVIVNVECTQEFQPSQQASLEYLDIPNMDGLDNEEIDKNDQANNTTPPESHKKKKSKVVKSKGKQIASKENNTLMPNSNSEEARSNPNGEEINIQKNKDWDSCVVVHVDKSCNEAATTFAMSQLDAHGGLVEFAEAPGFLQSVLAADLM
ncbi:hypothetical protein POM88_019870 [Heracleum sosnowskyi]|uniref:Uncharacterized protein n=1 Tax=Heracleum sosnowskyi TaxID=360622 RepID=A0AAD8IDX6_9APIA|nr:hypothetical protein POM88_019870 [Heracleum sosnowskyi]